MLRIRYDMASCFTKVSLTWQVTWSRILDDCVKYPCWYIVFIQSIVSPHPKHDLTDGQTWKNPAPIDLNQIGGENLCQNPSGFRAKRNLRTQPGCDFRDFDEFHLRSPACRCNGLLAYSAPQFISLFSISFFMPLMEISDLLCFVV